MRKRIFLCLFSLSAVSAVFSPSVTAYDNGYQGYKGPGHYGGNGNQGPGYSYKVQKKIEGICEGTLQTFYKKRPELRIKVKDAAGYGCFTNVGGAFLLNGSAGSGLVRDNQSGKAVYMNMGRAASGADVNGYRELLIFDDAQALQTFMNAGKSSSASSAVGVHVYSFIKGSVQDASSNGRQYWKNDAWN